MKPLWLRILLWCFSHLSDRLPGARPDRLSRCSKIGGEMVPHVKVEEQQEALRYSTTTPKPAADTGEA